MAFPLNDVRERASKLGFKQENASERSGNQANRSGNGQTSTCESAAFPKFGARTTLSSYTASKSCRIRSFRRGRDTPGTSKDFSGTRLKSAQICGGKTVLIPNKFPRHLATYPVYTTAKGAEIPLIHRDKVTKIIRQLDKDLKPIVVRFGVYYSVLCENHPQTHTAAYTNRVELPSKTGPATYFHCICIRVRNPACPNDVRRFYNKCTLLSVLFHELAHVRYMNHGEEFMFLLRNIYWFASESGVFHPGETNQLPSCRLWEGSLCATGGRLTNEELMKLCAKNPVPERTKTDQISQECDPSSKKIDYFPIRS